MRESGPRAIQNAAPCEPAEGPGPAVRRSAPPAIAISPAREGGLTCPAETRFNLLTINPANTCMNLAMEFAASTVKTAQKTAVFWGDTEYSYEWLQGKSCWLAARLQS